MTRMGLLRYAGGASVLLAAVGWQGAVAAPAPAVRPAAAPASARWSVADVRLGMAPAEVAGALKAAGYVLDHRSMGRSWQGEVANEVSNLRAIRIPAGAEVIRTEDYRKGQEQIQVVYLPAPTGPYVARVDYKIDYRAIDLARFNAAALARYGKPSRTFGNESLYCSPGERECARTGGLVTNQLPNLTVYGEYVMSRVLRLVQGERADRGYVAAVRAEAERLYPKKDKPTF
jgi:hypothetical protein